MQKMTSAYANKMLRSLEEDKNYWLKKESESSTSPEYRYINIETIYLSNILIVLLENLRATACGGSVTGT